VPLLIEDVFYEMVLRRQCCRLVGVSRPHTSYSPSLSRPLHTTLGRAQESGDSDHGIGETPESVKDNTVPSNAVAAAPAKRPFNVIPREEQELPEGFQKEMKAADIDRKMTPAELGLKMKRNSRRQFATWLLKAGRRYEHFPQNLLHELEERRVEKIRKRAEERMFARMNDFFNSLTSEEIESVSLKELAVKPRNGPDRERLEEPTPFQRLMTETLNPARLKEVESKVLQLLQTYDSATHTMYRNYIDWSDYKLQKQIIWIKFIIDPKDLELYGDLISRLQAIELLGRRGSGREAHSTITKYGMNYTRDKNDLAHYVGEALGPHKFLPAISPHYFFNRANESTPFLRNPKFKPWRPLSHKTRQQMFDAWREGMGLRNIAWLGGVSWRRVDGIIGILKREWDFVQQVISL
jgi:Eukaryotic mitochondrial regulator protein